MTVNTSPACRIATQHKVSQAAGGKYVDVDAIITLSASMRTFHAADGVVAGRRAAEDAEIASRVVVVMVSLASVPLTRMVSLPGRRSACWNRRGHRGCHHWRCRRANRCPRRR
jgi:hypothetical protein